MIDLATSPTEPPATGWTAERIERLKLLYANGLSASRIAAELGGVSRNGVIGKVHRLGLTRRGAGGNYNGNQHGAAGKKPKVRVRVVRSNANSNAKRLILTHEPAEVKALRCAEVVSLGIDLEGLNSKTCHYPYGDEPPFTFCGNDILAGTPYCAPHANLCWRAPEQRRSVRRVAA